MIGRIAAAGLLATGGCQSVPAAEEEVPVHGVTPGVECNAAAIQDLIGQPASAELGSDAMRRSGAGVLRWIQPGQAVTMDFRTDRLNIELDAQNRVTALRCG